MAPLPGMLPQLLAAAAPATAPTPGTQPTWQQLGGGLLCVLIPALAATVIAYFLGGWRSSVQGPPRIEAGKPFWPLSLAIAAAVFGLFLGGAFMGAWVAAVHGREVLEEVIRPPSPVNLDAATGARRAIFSMQLSAASYFCATLAALATVSMARLSGWTGRLGAAIGQLPRGVLWGALAVLLVIPWMLTASILLQMALKATGADVQTVHQIIRAMREFANPELIAWGLVSAVLVAPIAEEVLFRGVLQTTLVHAWARMFDPRPEPGHGFEVIGAGDATPALVSALPMPGPMLAQHPTTSYPLRYHPAAPVAGTVRHLPSAIARWAGIIATSALFAALHEAWSIPVIFVLSLALGYIYERTGNLWTSITVHLVFNAFNMLLALPLILGW